MKNVYLQLFISIMLTQLTPAQVGTFDFETATMSGANIIQSVGGVTLTVTSSGIIEFANWAGWEGLPVTH